MKPKITRKELDKRIDTLIHALPLHCRAELIEMRDRAVAETDPDKGPMLYEALILRAVSIAVNTPGVKFPAKGSA